MSLSTPLPPPDRSTADDSAATGAFPTERSRRVRVVVPPPRPGDMTRQWAVAFGLGWLAILVGLAGVWSTSRQLGLSTWWLGPAAAPRALPITLLPFAAPALLVAAAFNRTRYLAWWGLGGALVLALVALGDLTRVRGLGLVELALAGAGAALSLASLAGTYRR